MKKISSVQKSENLKKEDYNLALNNKLDKLNILANDIETKLNDGIQLSDLLKAFEKFLQKKEDNKPLNTKITSKEYSITKRSKEIKDIIKNKKRVNFKELFNINTKSYIIVTFLSILVLAKNNDIKLIQENNFEDIVLCEVS